MVLISVLKALSFEIRPVPDCTARWQVDVCEQLTQGCYLAVHRLGVEPATSWSLVRHAAISLSSHTLFCCEYHGVTECDGSLMVWCRMAVQRCSRVQVNSPRQAEWTRHPQATALATGAPISTYPFIRCSVWSSCLLTYWCQLFCGRFIDGRLWMCRDVCTACSQRVSVAGWVKPAGYCLCCHIISSRRWLCIYQWPVVVRFSHVGHILFLVLCTQPLSLLCNIPFRHILLPVASACYCSSLARFYF